TTFDRRARLAARTATTTGRCIRPRTTRAGRGHVDRMDIDHLRSALPRTEIANHGRAFRHLTHAGTLERRNVQEGIRCAVGRRHEAKSLSRIEPLDRHGHVGLFDWRATHFLPRTRRWFESPSPKITHPIAVPTVTPATVFGPITLPRHLS